MGGRVRPDNIHLLMGIGHIDNAGVELCQPQEVSGNGILTAFLPLDPLSALWRNARFSSWSLSHRLHFHLKHDGEDFYTTFIYLAVKCSHPCCLFWHHCPCKLKWKHGHTVLVKLVLTSAVPKLSPIILVDCLALNLPELLWSHLSAQLYTS